MAKRELGTDCTIILLNLHFLTCFKLRLSIQVAVKVIRGVWNNYDHPVQHTVSLLQKQGYQVHTYPYPETATGGNSLEPGRSSPYYTFLRHLLRSRPTIDA
jgi:hypothetical protein